jgi:hypothetical protein
VTSLTDATIPQLFAELARKGVTVSHETYGHPCWERFVTVARVPGLVEFPLAGQQ